MKFIQYNSLYSADLFFVIKIDNSSYSYRSVEKEYGTFDYLSYSFKFDDTPKETNERFVYDNPYGEFHLHPMFRVY